MDAVPIYSSPSSQGSGSGRFVCSSAPVPGNGKWSLVGSGGKLSGSGRRGVVGFGGRNDGAIVLKEVRDVLNRIRWDLAEIVGVEFSTVKVYVEDDVDVEPRLCRQWVREGRCERGRGCKYSHKHSLVGHGLRPSSKSSGSMGPWRVLEGYGVEASMASSSLATASSLHRALFIEYNDEVCWDKEDGDVWEAYVARVERGGGSVKGHASNATSSDFGGDELDLSKALSASGAGEGGAGGNGLLHRLPLDLCLELFTFLCPSDVARARRACVTWAERVGEPEVWAHFLDKVYHLTFPSAYGDARRDFERLATLCRNARLFGEARSWILSSPPGGGGEEAAWPGSNGSGLRRFSGHGRAVMEIHVDEPRDRLISAAVSGEVRIWELRSGVRLGTTDLRAPLSCMAVSCSTIYCGSGRGTLHAIDRDDLTSTQSVKLSSGLVALALLPAPTGLRAMFSRPAPVSTSSAPYMVAGLGNGSFVILQGLLPLHSYALPVSHPACVSVVPTGPEGFIAAASPDTLFVWQGPLPRGPEDVEKAEGPTKADGTAPPPLRVLVSSAMREDGRDTRHVDNEPCDVALTVLSEGLMGRQTVVSACNHDLCLRWWDLGVGGSRGGACTHMTEAFDLSGRTFGGGQGEARIGTLALAHAKGVLLSAHLDGTLVVWHVGQRTKVGVFSSLPLLEAVAMAPSTLGILASFEKHVIYSSEVRGEDEEEEGQGEVREGRSRSGGGGKGKPPGPFVKPRRRKTFPQKGGQPHHNHTAHH